jgi:hypothetical protein
MLSDQMEKVEMTTIDVDGYRFNLMTPLDWAKYDLALVAHEQQFSLETCRKLGTILDRLWENAAPSKE